MGEQISVKDQLGKEEQHHKCVTFREASALAKKYGLHYFEVSSLKKEGIETLFTEAVGITVKHDNFPHTDANLHGCSIHFVSQITMLNPPS